MRVIEAMATILHVDDEPAVGLMLEDTIRRAGHHPIGATNASEALRALSPGTVDLIVCDYQMPGINGLELLALVRGDGYDTPVIMMTGDASIEHAVCAIAAGAVGYVTKPLRPAQLELAVEQALELARLRRENDALRRDVSAAPRDGEIVLRTLDITEAEAVLIQHALAATGNNRTRAAKLLGISVRTLRNKLNGAARQTLRTA